MSAKGLQLGIELRIHPIGPEHRRFEIVHVEAPRHPFEMPEGVLQSPDESFGVLMQHGLAVRLAGVA